LGSFVFEVFKRAELGANVKVFLLLVWVAKTYALLVVIIYQGKRTYFIYHFISIVAIVGEIPLSEYGMNV
jgi:hypothetical protein